MADAAAPAAAPAAPPPREDVRALALRALAALLGAVDVPALVAGSACLAALLGPLVGEGRVTPPATLARLVPFGALAWALGVVCCAGGRQVRRSITRRLRPRQDRVGRALEAHGLPAGDGAAAGDDPLGLARCAGPTRVLQRLEAVLRETPALAAGARAAARARERVMAHDGLAAAALVAASECWLVPLVAPRWPLPWGASLVAGGLAALAAAVSWAEAHALERRRTDEVVAAIAAHLAARAPLGPRGPVA